MKLLTPVDQLAAQMEFVNHAPSFLPKFIGLSEVLGAIGLIVPAATRIKPALTPLAAAALTLVMVLAAITHIALGEFGAIVPSLVLGGLSAFVFWGRSKVAKIEPR